MTLLPHVENLCELLRNHRIQHEETFPDIAVVGLAMLLAALHFAKKQWREQFAELSTNLGKNSGDVFLQLFTIERNAKMNIEFGLSEVAVKMLSEIIYNPPKLEYNDGQTGKTLPRHLANSMRGNIHMLYATQLLNLGRDEDAMASLMAWKAFDPPSTAERATERYQQRTLADIFVAQNDVDLAEQILLNILETEGGERCRLEGSMCEGWTLYQLACIWMGQGQHKKVEDFPLRAIIAREKKGHGEREDTMLLRGDLEKI